MLNSRKFTRIKARQRGAAAVEFGIIAIVFFTLLFGIIEFGRLFYLYNTVQEVTRCAARQATVSWKDQWGDIKQQCLFGQDVLVAGWEIHADNVRLRALNLAGNDANPGNLGENFSNCAKSSADANCIRFVEAKIVVKDSCTTVNNVEICQPIQYQPMFGLIPVSGVGIPNSTVTMPAESLGY